MPRNKDKTKEKILKASAELIKEKNFYELTIAEIGHHACVTRQTMYRQFVTKDNLIAELFSFLFDRYKPEFSFNQEIDLNAKDKIKKFINEWNKFYSLTYGCFEHLSIQLSINGKQLEQWQDWTTFYRNSCYDFVTLLKHSEILSGRWTVSSATDLVLMVLSVESWKALRLESGWTEHQYETYLTNVISDSLIDKFFKGKT